jgi:hypothetical protein
MEEHQFDWDVRLGSSPVTRAMSGMSRLMPGPRWHKGAVLGAVGALAGPSLRAGRVRLQGQAPNGQHFVATPRLIWLVRSSRASLAGASFGRPGPLPEQARLGDFWIPQRGMFAIGEAYFEPLDVSRHRAVPSRAARQE